MSFGNPAQMTVVLSQIIGNLAHVANRSDMDPAARLDLMQTLFNKAWSAVSHVLQALNKNTLTEPDLMKWRDLWARGNGEFLAAIRAGVPGEQ